MTAVQEAADNAPDEEEVKARREALERASRAEEGLERAIRQKDGRANIPPSWTPFNFNGHVYYFVPLR